MNENGAVGVFILLMMMMMMIPQRVLLMFPTTAASSDKPPYNDKTASKSTGRRRLSMVPLYRVERAKTDRSRCKMGGKNLGKCTKQASHIRLGELRVGSRTSDGQYAHWSHLRCWRVPCRIWNRLPTAAGTIGCAAAAAGDGGGADAVQYEMALMQMNDEAREEGPHDDGAYKLFWGMDDLTVEERSRVVSHVMDQNNWARNGTTAAAAAAKDDAAAVAAVVAEEMTEAVVTPHESTQTTPVPWQRCHEGGGALDSLLPIPGLDGAQPNIMSDMTIVLSGTFPEAAPAGARSEISGPGLDLGKGQVRRKTSSRTHTILVNPRTFISIQRSNPRVAAYNYVAYIVAR